MTVKMSIVSDGKWVRKKIGTATFGDDNTFTIQPLGQAAATQPLAELQSVQWEPNGWSDKALRNPFIAFLGVLAIVIVVQLIGFLLTGKAKGGVPILGYSIGLTLVLAMGKVHRARFYFSNGQSALLSISNSFAKKIRSLKPGIGPQ